MVQGTNHFNGEEALAFSRERQNVPGGDNQRGKDQQAVITAMIKKMVSPAILTGANGILNSVSGNVETNMSQSQIQELIKTQLRTARPGILHPWRQREPATASTVIPTPFTAVCDAAGSGVS